MCEGWLLSVGRICPNASQLRIFCRSELAREKLTGAAFIQKARVIVDVFREQARSYSRRVLMKAVCLVLYWRFRRQASSHI